jgi:SAM-dependent methyltransferase
MTWTTSQKIMFGILVFLCVNYVFQLALDKTTEFQTSPLQEGFEDGGATALPKPTTGTESDTSVYTWTTDSQLIYDEFYSGVYDQLSNQADRTAAKIAYCVNQWKKDSPKLSEWAVLDAGCGTGYAVATFAKAGVGRVVGMDNAPAMLRQAERVVIPSLKLTEQQQQVIRWKQDSLINPSAASPSEFTHAVCMYFTFYYLKNQEEFFRHMVHWIKPGGKLVVEVVNKHKFDPILESASPFLAFSLQKYSKERIKKSKVAFDKFEYEAEFTLTDPKAEFYETFRFKNNHVRRQKHEFNMPNISEIVEMGKRAGWHYSGFQDLQPVGFEYGYLLFFEKK